MGQIGHGFLEDNFEVLNGAKIDNIITWFTFSNIISKSCNLLKIQKLCNYHQ